MNVALAALVALCLWACGGPAPDRVLTPVSEAEDTSEFDALCEAWLLAWARSEVEVENTSQLDFHPGRMVISGEPEGGLYLSPYRRVEPEVVTEATVDTVESQALGDEGYLRCEAHMDVLWETEEEEDVTRGSESWKVIADIERDGSIAALPAGKRLSLLTLSAEERYREDTVLVFEATLSLDEGACFELESGRVCAWYGALERLDYDNVEDEEDAPDFETFTADTLIRFDNGHPVGWITLSATGGSEHRCCSESSFESVQIRQHPDTGHSLLTADMTWSYDSDGEEGCYSTSTMYRWWLELLPLEEEADWDEDFHNTIRGFDVVEQETLEYEEEDCDSDDE